jgi:hypothetical protein
MTSTGLHDTGEEWKQKTAYRQDLISTRDADIEVLLYDDATDALTDASDVGDVTTEPTDGNYTRKTLTLDGANLTLEVASGDVRVTGTVTFDVTDTTGTVDAWATVVSLQSDVVNSEGSLNPHLLASASFGSTDLSNYSSVDVTVSIDLD